MYLNVQQRVGHYGINSQVSVIVIPRYLSTSEPQPGIPIYVLEKEETTINIWFRLDGNVPSTPQVLTILSMKIS